MTDAMSILNNPFKNKGTAFTLDERKKLVKTLKKSAQIKKIEQMSEDEINTYEYITTKFTGITYTGSSLLELFTGVAGKALTVETKWTIFTKQLVSVATKGTLSSTVGSGKVELNYIQIDDLYEIDSEGELWVH